MRIHMTRAQMNALKGINSQWEHLQKPPQSPSAPRRGRQKARTVQTPPTPIFEVYAGACRVEVPLPDAVLSTNGSNGRGWRKKVQPTRDYRSCCRYLFGKVMMQRDGKPFVRVRISYTWYMAPSPGDGLYRPKDRDRAISALTACQDGLRDSGLIADDTADTVTLGEVLLLRTASEHGGRRGVVVLVEEVTE